MGQNLGLEKLSPWFTMDFSEPYMYGGFQKHLLGQNATSRTGTRFGIDTVLYSAVTSMNTRHLAIAQAAIAACLLCIAIARPLLRRPLWLSRFAREEARSLRKEAWTFWTIFLGFFAVAGLVLTVNAALFPPFDAFEMLVVVPWLVLVLLTAMDRPTTTPKALLVLYATIFACDLGALLLTYKSLTTPITHTLASAAITVAAILAILFMPMRDPYLDSNGIGKSRPTYELRSPEDNLTLWNFMTVSWMAPLIAQGKKKQLNDEDIWQLPYEFQHGRLHVLFRDLRGSIIRRLFVANGLDLTIISGLGILECTANLSVPLLLEHLLASMKTGVGYKEASLWASAILAVRLIACQSSVFSLWFSRRCYERSRGEMITTLYAKTLTRKSIGQHHVEKDEPPHDVDGHLTTSYGEQSRLNRVLTWFGLRRKSPVYHRVAESKKPATTGKILNLMRSDVYEVAQRFWEFSALVTKPLQFILSFWLVWRLIGWPCLLGIACVFGAQILNSVFIHQLIRVERLRRAATDLRLQATSQFVEGLRHLRWYDWQSKWLERIMDSRQSELNLRITTGLWRIGISAINVASGTLFSVVTFFAYTFIAGNSLPSEVAFPALQLFAMLETSLKELPNLYTVFLNATVAMRRIEEFMEEPDKEEASADSRTTDIEFDGTSLAWPGYDGLVLKDIKMVFPKGLTVVFGRVGSGKTALLQAILGELDIRDGDCTLPSEMVGYCAQSPWLQHMSIRDNILFSAPFDPVRYARTLDTCALLPDLANFKHGDLSDMGENGIGLSGGQRARVALARAVYCQSRILLLDDPLAALDHNTAETIVRKLFQGPLMEGRTVVLVTHRVDLCLHLADQIIEIEDGTARVLDSQEAALEVAKFLSEEGDQDAVHGDQDAVMNEEQHIAAIPDKFIEEEHRASGGVVASVYWAYIRAGGLKSWAALILVFGLLRFASVFNTWFIKAWTEGYATYNTRAVVSPKDRSKGIFDGLPNPDNDVEPWVLVYLSIALAQTAIFIVSECLLLTMIYKAAKDLFRQVIEKVSRATFRFYDVTPVGRLMNRLLSDIGMIDGGIMSPLQQVAFWTISWATSMAVIARVAPPFLVFSVLLTLWFVYIFLRFLPSSQSLRRLEMASLSPLMSNFGILMDGLGTIRAFKAQPHFQNRNIQVTDAFQKMDHFYWSLQAWLMYRFDALSAVSTFVLTFLSIYLGLTPSMTGFVLQTASGFVEATHALCKQYGTLQMDFVSVERVIELLDIEEEPSGEIEPPPMWPSSTDDITFKSVTLRYAPHLDPSLSDASFSIPGGSTCAVLGRTGSGKSTLALALLATMHPTEGHIYIGNTILSEVDVHAWRQRISFVAQDPVLFPGTLRENLDPLEQHSDAECIAVLHRVLGQEWTLESHVDGGGKNLSQGQRQLVGIGRAVLRRSPIVVLDEATASIDKETAERVYEVLREDLKTSTVITIAHRLEAVKDANYFLRLDAGKVVEHGPTKNIGGGNGRE